MSYYAFTVFLTLFFLFIQLFCTLIHVISIISFHLHVSISLLVFLLFPFFFQSLDSENQKFNNCVPLSILGYFFPLYALGDVTVL